MRKRPVCENGLLAKTTCVRKRPAYKTSDGLSPVALVLLGYDVVVEIFSHYLSRSLSATAIPGIGTISKRDFSSKTRFTPRLAEGKAIGTRYFDCLYPSFRSYICPA